MNFILLKRDTWRGAICILMLLPLFFCSVSDSPVDQPTPAEEEPTTSTGVTLFAPQGLTTTYLIDENDDLVNTWESDYRPGLSVYLLEDKSLLRTAMSGVNGTFGSTGGAGGRVERFDWEGNLIWEYEYTGNSYLLHHDIEYLPNGNILMIAWEYKTAEEAIAAGRSPSLLADGELWPDTIIEVAPTGSAGGRIVWEWHIWDHLIQDYDADKANYAVVADHPGKINVNMVMTQGNADWTHCNAVDYNADLDQILVTVHNFSEIWIIDHNTTTSEAAGSAGDLLFRWGNAQAYDRGTDSDQQLFVPHDGHWIATDCPGAGDILIFNNGTRRPEGNYSTVNQITAPEDGTGRYGLSEGTAYGPTAPNWTYKADSSNDFYAERISGAQRLPDGNTLICNGPAGSFFEVTAAGQTVREYVNPYSASTRVGNSMFRVVRYWLDLN
ncbi:MAG: arylsulfotransferase [bacterium]|nr:arylsulfotransferase [bacterium]